LYLVGVLVKVAGERRAYVLDVQVPGEPVGLVEGRPVTIEGLEAAPWERDGRPGRGLSGQGRPARLGCPGRVVRRVRLGVRDRAHLGRSGF
jgi:hypothetical protein